MISKFRSWTVEQSQLVDQHRSKGETLGVDQSFCGHLSVHLEDGLEMLIEVLVGHAAQLVEDAPDLHAIVGVRVSSAFSGNQKPLLAFGTCLSDVGGIVVVSPRTKRASSGNSSMRSGATRLSAVLAGVSLAASGIHTSHTVMARCSFHPYTHPCQPRLVQPASVSMEVWGTMPASLSFLCHTPPLACKTVLSRATALPLFSQGLSIPPGGVPGADLLGKLSGKALRRLSKVRLAGKRPSSERQPRTIFISEVGSRGPQELSHPMQPPDDHDYQSLHRRASPSKRWAVPDGGAVAVGLGILLDKTDQLDKNTVLTDHGCASGSSVLGHTPSSEASRVRVKSR